MPRRAAVLYRLGLATLGLLLAAGSVASENGGLVPCYEPSRGLVQKVTPAHCGGEIVSPADAEKIRERIKRQRFRKARETTPRRQRAETPTESSGSGVLVTDAGHIVTAAHVVAGCQAIRTHHPAAPTREAQVVARHSTADLALLQMRSHDQTHPPIAFGNPPEPGAPASTIGYPNQGKTVIRPVRKAARYGGLRAVGNDGARSPIRIVFEGDLRPGNSGGALVDHDERIIGIVIAQIDTPGVYAKTGQVLRHVGFAEPLAAVQELLESSQAQLSSGKHPQSGTSAERSVFRVTCHSDRD